jgi:hypothetical protein
VNGELQCSDQAIRVNIVFHQVVLRTCRHCLNAQILIVQSSEDDNWQRCCLVEKTLKRRQAPAVRQVQVEQNRIDPSYVQSVNCGLKPIRVFAPELLTCGLGQVASVQVKICWFIFHEQYRVRNHFCNPY